MLQFDLTAFHYLNGVWTNPFFDWLMPVVTTQKNWVPLLVVGWFFLLLGFSGKFRRLALMIALVVILSDQISSHLIKPMYGRQRPCCSTTIEKRLLVGCTKSKSFPSSHATNSASVAGFVWLEAGWAIGLPLTLMSIIIAYSRVYVGVHYPLDVFAGFLLGWAVALLVWYISRKFPGRETNETTSGITGGS